MPLPLIPLAVAGGLAAAGAIGTAASGALGSGRKVGKYQIDRTNYSLGGDGGYARRRAAELQGVAEEAYGRNVVGASGARDAYGRSLEARAGQDRLAANLEARVLGQGGPSVAEMQLRRGQVAATQGAQNVAANARGGNYANASVAASDAATQGAANANEQAAMLRAQEQAQAEQRLAELYAAQRSGDFAEGQGLGGLALQERGVNDAQYNAGINQELSFGQADLQGSIAYSNADLQAALQEQKINAELAEAARQRKAQFWGSLIGAGAGIAGSAVGRRLCPTRAGRLTRRAAFVFATTRRAKSSSASARRPRPTRWRSTRAPRPARRLWQRRPKRSRLARARVRWTSRLHSTATPGRRRQCPRRRSPCRA